MADVYTLQQLSGSTDGKGIKVTGTGTGSTVTVHTATSGASDVDLVTLWCYCSHTAAVQLTLEWGAATDPDNVIIQTVQPDVGLVKLVEDLPIMNSLVVKAFAGTANVVVIYGSVLRVTN